MTLVTKQTTQKLHPHKFMMWVTIASLCMMFAGLTSAYLVKKSSDTYISFKLPAHFIWSTVVIVVSSLTMQIALKSIQAREMARYRNFLGITAFLGVLFAVIQILGFFYLDNHGIPLLGLKSNPSASFLLVIIGLHALHVLGGVIALVVFYLKVYFSKKRSYATVPVEVLSTYWHFVDILWIYLLIFLLVLR